MTRNCVLGLVALVVAVLATGCNKGLEEGPDFESRLKAAEAIQDPVKQDEALSNLALAAAEKGETSIVQNAVEAMEDSHIRDTTAGEAALNLARHGEGDAATTVAGLVQDPDLRDSILGKISESEEDEAE